jgi:phosphoserine phosphatase RsbU/P
VGTGPRVDSHPGVPANVQAQPGAWSSADGLRAIAHKVDQLIESLNSGGSAAAAAAGQVQGAERSLVPHLQRLVSVLDPAKLHATIIDSVVTVTGAERAVLLLLEDGTKLRFKNGHRIDPQTLASPQFAASRGVVKQVLTDGQPRCLAGPELRQWGLNEVHSVICVPLKFGKRLDGIERVGGAIYADCTMPSRALGQPHLELLAQIAEHAAIGLENAQIFHQAASAQQQAASAQSERETERRHGLKLQDNIGKLLAVGQALASTLVLEDLLVKVVDSVVDISRAQRGFVMLVEGQGEAKRLVYKVGRDARQRTLPESQFQYSTTVAHKVMNEGTSIVMTEMSGGDLSRSMVEMELRSILCVPLKEKDQVIGLVYVDSQQSNREFEAADKDIVESLCGQASVAIVNAKLYREAGEKERLSHELNIAARLQSELLPKRIPQVTGLEMHGFLTPALEVGGDYYDFIAHEGTNQSVTVAIGDVSGKGVGAGIVMAMARSALRSLIQRDRAPTSPLPIMQALNVLLCRDIPRNMFLTLNVLIWNAEAKVLTYTPAGHEHILVFRTRTRKVEKIKAGGVACGVLEQASAMMKEQKIQLEPGDHVVLYTDGVTEAMDVLHQQFGMDKLMELLSQHGHLEPKALIETIHAALLEHRGAADPHDDITLVALRASP